MSTDCQSSEREIWYQLPLCTGSGYCHEPIHHTTFVTLSVLETDGQAGCNRRDGLRQESRRSNSSRELKCLRCIPYSVHTNPANTGVMLSLADASEGLKHYRKWNTWKTVGTWKNDPHGGSLTLPRLPTATNLRWRQLQRCLPQG